MNEDTGARAATAVPCECGHAESWHIWTSTAVSGLMHASSCSFRWRRPPEGDEPKVRFYSCPCPQYRPDLVGTLPKSLR